jgi:hypothetical protein
MPTVRGAIARSTGTNRATQFRKSAAVSARAFAQSGALGAAAKRRKSLGGKGG